jgi:hypothetical protein
MVSILGHVPPSTKPKRKGKKRRIGEGPPKHDGQNEETLKGAQLNLIAWTKSLPSNRWMDLVFPPSKRNVR